MSDKGDENGGCIAAENQAELESESVTADINGLLVFDRMILDELADMLDDDEELDGYLALLEPTVRPRVMTLVRQSAAGEMAGLLVTAHALAGGAACYGLSALSAAARRVEDGARTAQLQVARMGVADAVALADASLSAVFRWRAARMAARTALLRSAAVL